MSEAAIETPLEPIQRLTRDLRESARTLTEAEARYLVDLYYTIQNYRIRSGNQVRAASEDDEPHALVTWSFDVFDTVEKSIRSAMQKYAQAHRAGEWALSIYGIGPVISAGLLAHIDIHKAPTVGHIWRFAGLDPTLRWGKGEKRPYNARLKVLCWKIGDSFVKLRGSEKDIYGKLYEARKALELERNERGDFAEQARATLEGKKIRKRETRATYEAGKLPAGRLDLRARRYAVKLFLAHLHHVMYESTFGEPPPKPYVIAIQGHGHYMGPPNW